MPDVKCFRSPVAPFLAACVALILSACLQRDGTGETAAQPAEPRMGYVLKLGEGEVLGSDIIKASPQSGTQGSVLIAQTMEDGFSTGLHTHLVADELFYVVAGNGMARIGTEDHPVEPGYVIFVPSGQEHKLFVNEGQRLEVLEFLDKPGLDEEFRAWHRRSLENPGEEVTLEQINAIARQYGTVYRTLE